MTFKIEKDSMGRYRISIGVGKTYVARSMVELVNAVKHYFENTHYPVGVQSCPLCQAMSDEAGG